MMEKNINDISKNIKKYRKANGMTQKDLAKMVGVSIAAVSNWETGSNSIDIDSLFKVCDALGVSISAMANADMQDTDQLTLLEKEIIKNYRTAAPPEQMMVLKLLKIEDGDTISRALKYASRFWALKQTKTDSDDV